MALFSNKDERTRLALSWADMKCWRKLSESLIQTLASSIYPLACFETSPHNKSVRWLIGELLVLNDVSAAAKNGASHRMNDSRLICAFQCGDEIHDPRVSPLSA